MIEGYSKRFLEKRAQVTVFIIIAILAIAAVAVYFVVSSGGVSQENLDPELQPVEQGFLSCVENQVLAGVNLLESQGGYIDTPDFERGSRYMPFSSHLDFLGTPVPYWHYISGNNIEKEQVPSKDLMESQLSDFVASEVRDNCRLRSLRDQGYEINKGEQVEAETEIRDSGIKVDINMDLAIKKGNKSAVVDEHTKTVKSNLGGLYEAAKKVYDYQRENFFLEDYGVDTLNSYAPGTDVEISCSPKTWNADKVFDRLETGIQSNTLALSNTGESDDYHRVDLPVSKNVDFVTFSDWPSTFEVEPSEGSTMIAEPLGDEQGLGALGFCFVNYHFVYDMKYPVMVQVSEGDETFQFPIDVVIEGNTARGPENGSYGQSQVESTGICQNRNTEVSVETFDLEGNPVDASVSYSCLGESCRIGEVSGGSIKGDFPQCANGFVISRAEGYETTRQQFSTIEGNSTVSVFMKELHELSVDLNLDGEGFSGNALINFVSESNSETISYPEDNSVELSEGNYNVSAYIYENTSISFDDVSSQQCIDVPTGVPGVTNERCFNMDIPSGISQKALTGGGNTQKVFISSELESSDSIEIDAPSLPEPDSIEGVRSNYNSFESKSIEVSLS